MVDLVSNDHVLGQAEESCAMLWNPLCCVCACERANMLSSPDIIHSDFVGGREPDFRKIKCDVSRPTIRTRHLGWLGVSLVLGIAHLSTILVPFVIART